MKTKIGDYIRWWVKDETGHKISHAGVIVEERPGWWYYYIVNCVDGKQRSFPISSRINKDTREVLYEPEYINWSYRLIGKA